MRRSLLAISLAAAVLGLAAAACAEVTAEQFPKDLIQVYAPLAIEFIQQQVPNPPVKVAPDPAGAVGYHIQKTAAVVFLPDKNLTAKGLDQAGDQDVPIGVVATKSLSLEDKDAVVKADRLAVADPDGTGQLKLPLFFLAARAHGSDRLLEIYSKDGKPLAELPLKKQSGSQDGAGLKLTNITVDKDQVKQLDAIVSLPGGYQGTVKLAYIDL